MNRPDLPQPHPLQRLAPAIAALLGALASVTAFAADPGTPGPLDRLSAAQRQRLAAGKPVFEHAQTSAGEAEDAGRGRALVLIDASVERCVELFSDLGRQHRYFPRKTVSEVTKTAGNRTWVRSEYDYAVRTIAYTVRYTYDPARQRFDFALDKSHDHDIEELAGYFLFEHVEDGCTLLSYVVTRLDTGLRVPEFIRKFVTERDLPNQVLNVKRYVESDGRWSK